MKRPAFLLLALALLAALPAGPASAQTCTGRFVNPIADVCWECLFPISIGPISIGSATGAPRHPEPRIAHLLLRLADPAHRTLARHVGAGAADRRDARPLVLPQSRRPHHRSRPARGPRAHRVVHGRRRLGLGLARPLLRLSAAVVDRGAARPRLPGGRRARHRLGLGARPGLARRRARLPPEPRGGVVRVPARTGGLRRRLRRGLGRLADRSAVLVRRLPGRDVSPDRQRRRPCRGRAGFAAGGSAPGLPPAPAAAGLGHQRLASALRALPDADHAEVAVPLADDPAGAGDLAAHRLQPRRALVGAVGILARAAGLGRELRLPAVAQAQLLPSSEPLEAQRKTPLEPPI